MARASERVWATVGKTALVIGVLGGAAGLWSTFNSPKEDLEAEAYFTDFRWPDSARRYTTRLQQALESDQLLTAITEKDDSEEIARSKKLVALELAHHFFGQGIRREPEYLSLDGFWSILIKNTGDLGATGVSLTLPRFVEATIIRGGVSEEIQPITNVISINEVRPRETVTVIAWTGWRAFSSRFDGREIVLAHSRGVGKVALLEPRPPPFIPEGMWDLVAIAILALVLLVLTIIAAYKNSRPPNQASEAK